MHGRLHLLIGAVVVCSPPTWAQDDSTAPTSAILRAAPEVEQRMAALRGLAFDHSVPKEMMTKDELRAEMLEEVQDEEVLAELRKEELMLRAFGVLDPGVNLVDLYVGLYSSMVAGFYDPDEKELRCTELGDYETEMNTLVHEVYHSLQDQHFPLNNYTKGESLTLDQTTAHLGLIEGDAEFFTARYFEQHPIDQRQLRGRPVDQGAMMATAFEELKMMREVPAYFIVSSMWPYTAGPPFVEALYEQGGWNKVTAAFESPPTSSEQVAHPEKFLQQNDPPVEVTWTLPATLTSGAEPTLDTVLGEVPLNHIVFDLSSSSVHGTRASQGWGGDRLQVYETERGPLLAYRIVLDTERDAREFQRAWIQCASKSLQHATKDLDAVITQEVDHRQSPAAVTVKEGRNKVDASDHPTLPTPPEGMILTKVGAPGQPSTWIAFTGRDCLVLRGALDDVPADVFTHLE